MLGVDVSHWQEENGNVINWQKVADSGHVFAFHKATEGTTYSDPRYDGNRTDAENVGLPFGAYHFARPSGGTITAAQDDGVAEAQHFLNIAQPASGDLLPVLDLEANGNLPVRRLTAWVQSWLNAVFTATGVKPIIYTGPHFWETYMNNTSTFAEQEFPLWIAHYTSGAPRVPGNNWDGRGWAFWQFTSQGQVPGIRGNADRNYFSGADLNQYKIPGAPLPTPSPDPAIPPSNEAPPTISGGTEVGDTLTATSGTWAGSDPKSYTYEWQRCDADGFGCSGVFHGTASSYDIQPADFGHRLKVTVIATNSAGSSSEDSALTDAVTDTVPPGSPTMMAPDATRTMALTMDVEWGSGEAGVSAYDVRHRATTQSSDFGDHSVVVNDSPDRETRVDVAPGGTHCFSARAIDEAGNASEWSSERCSAVPLDDVDLQSAGFTRRTGRAFFAGTISNASKAGSVLSVATVRVRDLYVVASRCRGCGKIAISFEGRRVAKIDLAARSTAHQRVIRVGSFSSIRTGKVQIRVISRNLPVKIDGILLGLGF
jgi:GH25 family lysozyme M1 (1,4-beta-N-acetylmuramidase)